MAKKRTPEPDEGLRKKLEAELVMLEGAKEEVRLRYNGIINQILVINRILGKVEPPTPEPPHADKKGD